ncbi:hypothetical protein KYC5002_37095 [Archangium violaceum]|uniref:hypothetical protein n=1 Tax=Archangium violaceum TaxID=83451 RepID=UPI002B30073C|nr:hypothetical protein KYC5002_37095 [Archangium gephyra]
MAAVKVRVADNAGEAWAVEEVQFLTKDGEALEGVRLSGPAVVPAHKSELLHAVVAPSERMVPGTYTLRLMGSGREFVLENVTFK